MVKLGPPIEKNVGKVLFINIDNFPSKLFPLCFWIDNVFCRVSRFLSYDRDQNILNFLVETNDSIQILIRLDMEIHGKIISKEHNKLVFNADFYVPAQTLNYSDNGARWDNIKNKKAKQSSYPFAKLSHFTEAHILPLIENSGKLLPTKSSMSGKNNIKIPFCNLTDIETISYTFDFFPLAMVEKNGGLTVLWEDDDGSHFNCTIYEVNKKLDAKVDFLIDMRLIVPNPVIDHYKSNEQWWEVLMPNIFRIACDSISLKKKNDIYEITEQQINGYLPAKGFKLARGDDVLSLESAFHDIDIDDLF